MLYSERPNLSFHFSKKGKPMLAGIIILVYALFAMLWVIREESTPKQKYAGKHRKSKSNNKYTVESYLNREGLLYV